MSQIISKGSFHGNLKTSHDRQPAQQKGALLYLLSNDLYMVQLKFVQPYVWVLCAQQHFTDQSGNEHTQTASSLVRRKLNVVLLVHTANTSNKRHGDQRVLEVQAGLFVNSSSIDPSIPEDQED